MKLSLKVRNQFTLCYELIDEVPNLTQYKEELIFIDIKDTFLSLKIVNKDLFKSASKKPSY